jgi:hypothetical protein
LFLFQFFFLTCIFFFLPKLNPTSKCIEFQILLCPKDFN